MRRTFLVLTLGLLASVPARADSFPNFDVTKTCHQNIELNGKTDQAAFESCIKDEASYKQKAQTEWTKIPVADRVNCSDLSQMVYPDYVELSVCLDMYNPSFDNPTGISHATPGAAKGTGAAVK